MTGRDVSDSDMPNFPWPGRRDAPAIGDAALAALLAGTQLPEDPEPVLLPVADVVAALRAGPARDELAREAAAMAEFRDRVGVSSPARPPRPRRPRLLTTLLSAKVAATVAAAAISLGGLATAAYAGVLPAPVQRLAHDTLGTKAPSAGRHAGGPSAGRHFGGRPAGGHGPLGLCAAYFRARAHGTPAQQAAALRRLEKAAGGAGKITAYCGAARHRPPRHWRRHGCWPRPHPAWTASAHPTWTPAPHPTWTATAHPTAPASCAPGPRPTSMPRPRHGHPGWPAKRHPGQPHPTAGPVPSPRPSVSSKPASHR
jgi:hypothetical protein